MSGFNSNIPTFGGNSFLGSFVDNLSGITELNNGYWWHAKDATGLGTSAFKVPENNGHILFDFAQATVASQPTALSENGSVQFRMRNAGNANPSILGSAAPSTAGWTGATYIGGWFRLPSGVPTGNGGLFQHSTTTGNQNRINLSISIIGINATTCIDGTAASNRNNSVTSAAFANLGWHWIEATYLGVGIDDEAKLPIFVDFVRLPRLSGVSPIPASIFNANARVGIGSRFQNALSNIDTTDWASCFYCNGIPSANNRRRMASYYPPTAITF